MPKSESGIKQKNYLQTHQIFSDLHKFSKGDMVELSDRQGRVGGVMLDEEVGESVELGARLRHPLKRLDVGEDGGSQVLVDLPHAGQLWPDVAIHVTPAHQPGP